METSGFFNSSMGCAMMSISRGITKTSFCCKHFSLKAKLFNSALNVTSSIEVPTSLVSIKILSSDEKNTLGQLKLFDTCLFLPILLQPKSPKKEVKSVIFS